MSQNVQKFAVVVFVRDGDLGVIPCSWLSKSDTHGYWPHFRDANKITKAIREEQKPDTSQWSEFEVRVLAKADNYSEARRQCEKAELTSDVHSEEEYGRGKRKVQAKRTWTDSPGSSEDDSGSTIVLSQKKLLLEPPSLGDIDHLHTSLYPLKRRYATTERLDSSGDLQKSESCPSTAFAHSSSDLATVLEMLKEMQKDQKRLMHAMSKCQATVEDHGKTVGMMHHLMKTMKSEYQCMGSGEDEFKELKEIIPIKSMENFDKVEERLVAESAFRALMKRRLRLLGGSDIKRAVKIAVDATMTNALQRKFNWEGRLGWKTKTNEVKRAFKCTKLCSVIKSLLLANSLLATNEEEIGRTLRNYLRNAADRDGGRTQRSLTAGVGDEVPSQVSD